MKNGLKLLRRNCDDRSRDTLKHYIMPLAFCRYLW